MKRLAWIIGGTSGIGLEIAHRLRHHVDAVVALGRTPTTSRQPVIVSGRRHD